MTTLLEGKFFKGYAFYIKAWNTPLHQVLQKDSAIQDYWIDSQNTVLYLTVGEKQQVTKYNITKNKTQIQTNVLIPPFSHGRFPYQIKTLLYFSQFKRNTHKYQKEMMGMPGQGLTSLLQNLKARL